jgi:hypothetical protein
MMSIVGCMVIATLAWGARGRPVVTNKTMVADNGELLRGVSCHSLDYVRQCSWDNLSWWTDLRDKAKVNCVRFMAYTDYWKGTVPDDERTSIAIMQQRFDRAVENAAEAGIYLILDDHSTCCTGYTTEQCSTFWAHMAPRYKDQTHVIYELKNEPSDGGDSKTVNLNKKIHPLIRAAAPQTPIIILSEGGAPDENFLPMIRSFNSAINIANDGKTVVGFHGYGDCSITSYSQINIINQAIGEGFPVFMTESGNPGAKCDMLDFATYWQNQGIAWIFLFDNTRLSCPPLYMRQTGFDYRYTPTWPRDPGSTQQGKVSTPTLSPPAGSFADAVQVTLSCLTTGAKIRYTLDGSAPSASSALYATPSCVERHDNHSGAGF